MVVYRKDVGNRNGISWNELKVFHTLRPTSRQLNKSKASKHTYWNIHVIYKFLLLAQTSHTRTHSVVWNFTIDTGFCIWKAMTRDPIHSLSLYSVNDFIATSSVCFSEWTWIDKRRCRCLGQKSRGWRRSGPTDGTTLITTHTLGSGTSERNPGRCTARMEQSLSSTFARFIF